MHTKYSNKYPPINRVETSLGLIEIEIVGADKTYKTDPNGAAVLGCTKVLPVKTPCGTSVLSGEPGFVYRTSDGISIALSESELMRLLRRELRPDELLKLHSLYGTFHETHDDFYDEDSGESLQGMSDFE